MRTATCSASKMDPSLETACLSCTGSPAGGKMIAPTTHGPGMGMHEKYHNHALQNNPLHREEEPVTRHQEDN